MTNLKGAMGLVSPVNPATVCALWNANGLHKVMSTLNMARHSVTINIVATDKAEPLC